METENACEGRRRLEKDGERWKRQLREVGESGRRVAEAGGGRRTTKEAGEGRRRLDKVESGHCDVNFVRPGQSTECWA